MTRAMEYLIIDNSLMLDGRITAASIVDLIYATDAGRAGDGLPPGFEALSAYVAMQGTADRLVKRVDEVRLQYWMDRRIAAYRERHPHTAGYDTAIGVVVYAVGGRYYADLDKAQSVGARFARMFQGDGSIAVGLVTTGQLAQHQAQRRDYRATLVALAHKASKQLWPEESYETN